MKDWTDYPEFKSYKSFEDIEEMFERLGLDFIKPVKTKWSYDLSKEDFKSKVEKLSLKTKKSYSKEENWIIKEVLSECRLIGLRDKGFMIVDQ